MKPYQINLTSALILIVMGLWGYFSTENPSATAFIPVVTGIILLALTPGMKQSNKVIAHLSVFLTLIILIALIKPLSGGFSRNDTAAILRVSIMMITCTIALILYIKNFIDVRKQRI